MNPTVDTPGALGGRMLLIVVLVGLIATLPGMASSITEEEVEQARVEREAAAADRAAALDDVEAAVTAYETANNELEGLTFQMALVRDRIDRLERELDGLRDEARERAVESYMSGAGGSDPVALFLLSDSLEQAVMVSELVESANADEQTVIANLESVRAELATLKAQLAADGVRAEQLRVDTTALIARMNELFVEADAEFVAADASLQVAATTLEEQRRREEEERLRRLEEERLRLEAEAAAAEAAAAAAAAAAVSSGAAGVDATATPGFVCPIDGKTWFHDTWGAPRSGGRRHKGTDMFAARGTPLVAVGDGTVKFGVTRLGGKIVWLYTDYGANYFYAHMDRFPAEVKSGDTVHRGQLIGYVGDTGNSDPGAYHLHFGVYPTGTFAVNPYPTVRRACG